MPTFSLPTPTPMRKKIYSPEERGADVDKYLHRVNMCTVWELSTNFPEHTNFEWDKKKCDGAVIKNTGPPPVLTKKEEKELEAWVSGVQSQG